MPNVNIPINILNKYQIGNYIDSGFHGDVYEHKKYKDVVVKVSKTNQDTKKILEINKVFKCSNKICVDIYEHAQEGNLFISLREKVNCEYSLNKEDRRNFSLFFCCYDDCLRAIYRKEKFDIKEFSKSFIKNDNKIYKFVDAVDKFGFIFGDLIHLGEKIHNIGLNLKDPEQYLIYDL